MNTNDDNNIIDVDKLDFVGRIDFNPDEQPSKIMPRDWYRLLRMIAIDRHHIMQLFHQTHGLKEFTFDQILHEIAENFGVPYEKLRDVSFEGYS